MKHPSLSLIIGGAKGCNQGGLEPFASNANSVFEKIALLGIHFHYRINAIKIGIIRIRNKKSNDIKVMLLRK